MKLAVNNKVEEGVTSRRFYEEILIQLVKKDMKCFALLKSNFSTLRTKKMAYTNFRETCKYVDKMTHKNVIDIMSHSVL